MGRPPEDWAAVLDRLLEGDRLACMKLSRLITGLLAHWRAYDFREEWDDIVQEVLAAVVSGAQRGSIRSREATFSYVKQVAHHKFVDRLKRHRDRKEDETVEWAEPVEGQLSADAAAASTDLLVGVRRSLEKLPERHRQIVYGVYGQGRTYEQVAEETGVPLGTLKRYLRDALAELRLEYAHEEPES